MVYRFWQPPLCSVPISSLYQCSHHRFMIKISSRTYIYPAVRAFGHNDYCHCVSESHQCRNISFFIIVTLWGNLHHKLWYIHTTANDVRATPRNVNRSRPRDLKLTSRCASGKGSGISISQSDLIETYQGGAALCHKRVLLIVSWDKSHTQWDTSNDRNVIKQEHYWSCYHTRAELVARRHHWVMRSKSYFQKSRGQPCA